MTRRRGIAIGLAAVAVAASCSSRPDRKTPADLVVLGTTELAGVFDPAACYEIFCSTLLLPNTHDTLVGFASRDSRPTPALARSWTVSDDGLIYQFALRHGVVFHDGTPFDAEAMRASLERVKRLAAAGGAAFLLYDTAQPPKHGIVGIDTPTPDTLVIRLAAPDSAFLDKLAYPVASAASPKAYPADAKAGDDVVVGTGPYRLARFEPAEYVELVRNERHWRRTPANERVRIRFFTTSAAMRAAVEGGQIDAATRDFEPSDLAALRGNKDLRVRTGPGAAVRLLVFNTARPPFADARVRAAVAAAVDRGRIVRAMNRTADPLYSVVPRGFDEHRDVFKAPGDVDDLLSRAGVTGTVSFDLWYTPTHYGESEAEAARALKAALEATGRFTVGVKSAEWADFKSSFARGELGAFLLGYYPDYLDPLDYLETLGSSAGTALIGSNFAAPEVDDLVSRIRRTIDAKARGELVLEAQRRLEAGAAFVPLWQPRQVVVTSASLAGLTLDISQQLRLHTLSKPA